MPWAPPGLRLTGLEGAGEVQTPLDRTGRVRRCWSARWCGSGTRSPARWPSTCTTCTCCGATRSSTWCRPTAAPATPGDGPLPAGRRLATRSSRSVLAAPPTLGAGRLVCVDGPAGSGKTTLAAALDRALPRRCAAERRARRAAHGRRVRRLGRPRGRDGAPSPPRWWRRCAGVSRAATAATTGTRGRYAEERVRRAVRRAGRRGRGRRHAGVRRRRHLPGVGRDAVRRTAGAGGGARRRADARPLARLAGAGGRDVRRASGPASAPTSSSSTAPRTRPVGGPRTSIGDLARGGRSAVARPTGPAPHRCLGARLQLAETVGMTAAAVASRVARDVTRDSPPAAGLAVVAAGGLVEGVALGPAELHRPPGHPRLRRPWAAWPVGTVVVGGVRPGRPRRRRQR